MRGALVRAALVYTAASAWLFRGVLGDPTSRAPLGGGGDVAQMCWFLARTAHAISHGDDLFVAHEMNAPQGVNLMWNTAMLPVGVLLAPITLWLGPLASFNAAMVAGPVLTGLTARWWLSRHVEHELARLVGGAAVGFSPFVAAHLGGHLNFVLLPLVPVILRLLEDAVWRHPGDRRRALLLGAAVALQVLLSEEVVLLVGVGVAVACGIWFLQRRGDLALARAAAGPLLLAVGVCVALLAVPLGVQLFGPYRVSGVDPSVHHATLRELVVPSTRWALGSLSETERLEVRGTSRFEDAAYVGVPCVVLLLGALAWWRKRPEVVTAAGTALVAVVLTWGNGGAGRGSIGVGHPAGPALAGPGLSSIVASRFALPLDLALAWLLAVTCQATVRGTGRPRAALAGLLAAVAVTWVPAAPEGQAEASPPAWFTSGQAQQLEGRTVVLLPAPVRSRDRVLLYQAAAGMPFHISGSYALSVDRSGRQASNASPDPVTSVVSSAWPQVAEARRCSLRPAVLGTGASAVVVVQRDDPGARLRRVARWALGEPSEEAGGVSVWDLSKHGRCR